MTSTVHGRSLTAIDAIRRAAAAVAVKVGHPTKWRLNQILMALELFALCQFEYAAECAARAELPAERIPEDEAAADCPYALGAVLDMVRRLKPVL